jgi:hypothetical protein
VLGSPTTQDVIAEITEAAGVGNGGYARRKRTGVYRSIRMPVFDRFVPSRREAIPAAYLIPPRLHEIVELLRRHGIVLESLPQPWRTAVNSFRIDSVSVQPLFEGHRTVQAEGLWQPEPFDTTLAAGWYLVRTDQRLGVLAAYLLEPASEDGVVTWNLLDRELQPDSAYPILRLLGPTQVPATMVP